MNSYSIVDIGKEFQKYGLRVGEHPAFGKVGKHAPKSFHYLGQAIDVTDYRPDKAPAFQGGKPIDWKQRTAELAYRAKQSGLFQEALGPGDPGHETHVHLALPSKVQASPELLQWIATGRYKTAEGKLTDVMPTLQTQQQSSKISSTPTSDTVIVLGGGKQRQTTEDFLKRYADEIMSSEIPQFRSVINPSTLLAQAFQPQELLT